MRHKCACDVAVKMDTAKTLQFLLVKRGYSLSNMLSDGMCDAAGQRDAAQKRLQSLERLLLRADPTAKPHQVTSLTLPIQLQDGKTQAC